MHYTPLGRTGMRVSRLCCGTMTFGNPADKKTSEKIFKRTLEAGINFFDCANIYADGEAEKILGKCIARQRDRLIITSKVYNPVGPDINDRGCSRRHILKALDDSLRRLNTDYLDIYFLHQFDAAAGLEETFATLNTLVERGKIHYIGVSNFAAWQVVKAQSLCAQRGWHSIACIQPMYNLVKRQAEVEILPMAGAENLGVITYSPLGGGLLSGKYAKGAMPPEGRLTENKQYRQRYGQSWMHESMERFVSFAASKRLHPVSLAIAWAAYHPAVTAPIIGARDLEQLEPALQALEIPLTPDLYRELSLLSPTPPPATDRTEEV